ncbi:hypothetical protein C9413_06115 [Rhizobium sp. SEMIA 4085]|uniref:Uncharacterized protein n=1 Tax=Rhizobium gallicum bv. gallicum R602sp TaxID=1041138 RepID=A0A0B4XDZ3_9HYPH|nr:MULTISPECIES: hypothetical protein [Rhizobium]AJD44727.1 hypothetical protein RGR602_PC00689 [Rhizobium gallicum bv. gallicum R602sp]NNH29095.1 hypothetical protein [Rhizobium sp. SEMIA 4085]
MSTNLSPEEYRSHCLFEASRSHRGTHECEIEPGNRKQSKHAEYNENLTKAGISLTGRPGLAKLDDIVVHHAALARLPGEVQVDRIPPPLLELRQIRAQPSLFGARFPLLRMKSAARKAAHQYLAAGIDLPGRNCCAHQIVGRFAVLPEPIRAEQFCAWEWELQINTLKITASSSPCGRDEIGDAIKVCGSVTPDPPAAFSYFCDGKYGAC